MEKKFGSGIIKIVKGDITELSVDAITNAANSGLVLGAGVAGAIRTKGGPSIQEECNRIGHCPVGGAVITGGGKLKARHVIHAVGPRWGEGDEREKLENATRATLRVADEKEIGTVALPAISTGIFGFPLDLATQIMIKTASSFLKDTSPQFLKEVIFCLFDDKTYKAFENELSKY